VPRVTACVSNDCHNGGIAIAAMAYWKSRGEAGLGASEDGITLKTRPFRWRSWRLVAALLLGLSAPGAWAQAAQTLQAQLSTTAPGVNDALCRTLALPMVYAITMAVALGTFMGQILVNVGWKKKAGRWRMPSPSPPASPSRWIPAGRTRAAMG
jgi:hypothetical protein